MATAGIYTEHKWRRERWPKDVLSVCRRLVLSYFYIVFSLFVCVVYDVILYLLSQYFSSRLSFSLSGLMSFLHLYHSQQILSLFTPCIWLSVELFLISHVINLLSVPTEDSHVRILQMSIALGQQYNILNFEI